MKIIDQLRAIDGLQVVELSYMDTNRKGYAFNLYGQHVLTIEPVKRITDKFKWNVTANNTGLPLKDQYGTLGNWLLRIINKLT